MSETDSTFLRGIENSFTHRKAAPDIFRASPPLRRNRENDGIKTREEEETSEESCREAVL